MVDGCCSWFANHCEFISRESRERKRERRQKKEKEKEKSEILNDELHMRNIFSEAHIGRYSETGSFIRVFIFIRFCASAAAAAVVAVWNSLIDMRILRQIMAYKIMTR